MQPKYGDEIHYITPENVKIFTFGEHENTHSFQKSNSIEIIDIEGEPFIAVDEIKSAMCVPSNVSIGKHFKDYSYKHFARYENSRRNLYFQICNEYAVKRALVSMTEDRTSVYQDIIRENARYLYQKLVEEIYPTFYADQKPVLTSFVNDTLGSVRVVNIDGASWFVAKDVCDVLGIKNARDAVSKLDDDEKYKLPRKLINGVTADRRQNRRTETTPFVPIDGENEINIINEYGLWQLVFTSNKPEAKQFKRWLAHEVIPSIRKTGSYSVFKQLKGGDN